MTCKVIQVQVRQRLLSHFSATYGAELPVRYDSLSVKPRDAAVEHTVSGAACDSIAVLRGIYEIECPNVNRRHSIIRPDLCKRLGKPVFFQHISNHRRRLSLRDICITLSTICGSSHLTVRIEEECRGIFRILFKTVVRSVGTDEVAIVDRSIEEPLGKGRIGGGDEESCSNFGVTTELWCTEGGQGREEEGIVFQPEGKVGELRRSAKCVTLTVEEEEQRDHSVF